MRKKKLRVLLALGWYEQRLHLGLLNMRWRLDGICAPM